MSFCSPRLLDPLDVVLRVGRLGVVAGRRQRTSHEPRPEQPTERVRSITRLILPVGTWQRLRPCRAEERGSYPRRGISVRTRRRWGPAASEKCWSSAATTGEPDLQRVRKYTPPRATASSAIFRRSTAVLTGGALNSRRSAAIIVRRASPSAMIASAWRADASIRMPASLTNTRAASICSEACLTRTRGGRRCRRRRCRSACRRGASGLPAGRPACRGRSASRGRGP